jgi:hypothetical protein
LKSAAASLLVGGCVPAINPERLAKIHDGPIFTPRTLTRLGVAPWAETAVKTLGTVR